MKSIKRWIRDYFHFNQRETNGFILLILALAIIAVFPFLWKPKEVTYDLTRDRQILDSLAVQLETSPYDLSRPKKEIAVIEPIPPELLQPFDPNKLTQAEWEKFGLPSYVAKRLLTYRDKAHGFTYKDQIQRIYGFPPELYTQLEPYITLPAKNNNKAFAYSERKNERSYPNYPERTKPTFTPRPFILRPFDINTADTIQLKQLRGIGSKLATRIVKFRDKLGGFENLEQLREVYGLPAEMVDSLRKYTFVDKSFQANKVNINAATLAQLQQHPYLGYKLGRHIVAYRTQHGPFSSLDDLRNIKTLDEATYQKIKPYLTL
ncbi:ComEA family DNA-binding protein [Adhaeribacter radiodurans]|uniref:Helix-hairpin-helix domain-containing protein n=1 Tax=Adhaeribacter radiodurans TaxID=2745197 RepID=A0A7L7L4E8_9BACT|nr:helix-hairpin-helix domain-containing protein [Adhaeribacter radiodurans]QMU27465.1 helix-hairpin-helix domain-containing protein [Adhaeribacter radiodurans]